MTRQMRVAVYLLSREVPLDQGPHHLLWGAGGADVGKNEFSVGLLCIADPPWIHA